MLNEKYYGLRKEGDVESPDDFSAVGQQYNNPKVWLENQMKLGNIQPVVINNNTTNTNTTQGVVTKVPAGDNSSAKAAAAQ